MYCTNYVLTKIMYCPRHGVPRDYYIAYECAKIVLRSGALRLGKASRGMAGAARQDVVGFHGARFNTLFD
jgi:hypothetical protein